MDRINVLIANGSIDVNISLCEHMKREDECFIVGVTDKTDHLIKAIDELEQIDIVVVDYGIQCRDEIVNMLKAKKYLRNCTLIYIADENNLPILDIYGGEDAYVLPHGASGAQIYQCLRCLIPVILKEKSHLYYERAVNGFDMTTALIAKQLNSLGFNSGHNGFKYLCIAIRLYIENRGVRHNVTGMIYPKIGKQNGVTASDVERGIRYAIEYAWLMGSTEKQEELFGYTIEQSKGKPTNKECIATIGDRVMIDLASKTRI